MSPLGRLMIDLCDSNMTIDLKDLQDAMIWHGWNPRFAKAACFVMDIPIQGGR
jgi:hypothetical protein